MFVFGLFRTSLQMSVDWLVNAASTADSSGLQKCFELCTTLNIVAVLLSAELVLILNKNVVNI